MTSKDKTGDKLVASMRKSKTGTVKQKTSERSALASATPNAATPVKKKAAKPKKAGSTTKAKTKNAAVATATSEQKQGKGFSHGRRVWPD